MTKKRTNSPEKQTTSGPFLVRFSKNGHGQQRTELYFTLRARACVRIKKPPVRFVRFVH